MQVNDKSIVAIMVNYKTPELVIAGLSALNVERASETGLHVVVVDNASGDHSLEFIGQFIESQQWGDWVKLVAADKNGFLESCPRAIAGSRLEDRDGTVQISAFNFPSLLGEMCAGFSLGLLDKIFVKSLTRRSIPGCAEPVDWLAGASVMFSRQVYDELGGLDEEYFLYYEEVDYLLNANRKGIQCWYVPESRVVHEVGAATGISDARKKQPRRPAYWFESRRRYYIKNHGRLYLMATDFLWSVGYATWYARKLIVAQSIELVY